MFCGKCGTEIQAGAGFCPNCGEAISASAPTAPAQPVQSKGSTSKSKAIIAAVLAVVIVIAAVVIGVSSAKGYEKAAVSYLEASAVGDLEEALDCTVMDFDTVKEIFTENIFGSAGLDDASEEEAIESFNDFFSEAGVEIKSKEDIFDAAIEVYQKVFREEMGDFTVDVQVLSSTELDEDEIFDYVDDFGDMYSYYDMDIYDYFEPGKIKKAYEVKCRVKAEGLDDGPMSQTTELIVVKYKGKWKVLSSDALSALDVF